MIKAIGLLSRKAGTTKEEFMRHWTEVHAVMVDTVPQVRRYHLNFIVDEPGRADVPNWGLKGKIDGIAEVWFDNRESYDAFRASEAGKTWLADGASFIGRSQSFLVEEKIII